jgi:hypothetical protein
MAEDAGWQLEEFEQLVPLHAKTERQRSSAHEAGKLRSALHKELV